jgi:hypothetical protein
MVCIWFLRASSMYDLEVTRGRRGNSGDDICTVIGGWEGKQGVASANRLACISAVV